MSWFELQSSRQRETALGTALLFPNKDSKREKERETHTLKERRKTKEKEKEKKEGKAKKKETRIVELPKTNGRPKAFANYGYKPIQVLMRGKEERDGEKGRRKGKKKERNRKRKRKIR